LKMVMKGKNVKQKHYRRDTRESSKLVKRNISSSLRRKEDVNAKGLPTGRMTVVARPVKGARRARRK
jgi:hypothetical protein